MKIDKNNKDTSYFEVQCHWGMYKKNQYSKSRSCQIYYVNGKAVSTNAKDVRLYINKTAIKDVTHRIVDEVCRNAGEDIDFRPHSIVFRDNFWFLSCDHSV